MELNRPFYFLMVLCAIHSCTTNPFWDDAATRELKIDGYVLVEGKETDVPVFVWADILNIHAKTDPDGYFSLPVHQAQAPTGNINGPMQVYFYIHNYILDSATVFFTDGKFSNEQTDFSNDGELTESITLKKIISVDSYCLSCRQGQPPSINLNYEDSLTFIFALDLHRNSRISAYKKVLSQQEYLPSGVLFRNVSDGFMYIYRLANDRLIPLDYARDENIIIRFDIDHDSLQVHSGPYEVIPFFLVNQNTIPLGLIDALGGESLFEIGEEYLQLPIDFKYDTLQISN